MLKFDDTLSVVTVIAVMALISPPVTALIEGIFKLVLKYIEYRHSIYDNEYIHKRELFENFLECTAKVSLDYDKYIEELMSSYFSLTPYVPKDDWVFFKKYSELVLKGNTPETHEQLTILLNEHIVPCIKRELGRYKHLND